MEDYRRGKYVFTKELRELMPVCLHATTVTTTTTTTLRQILSCCGLTVFFIVILINIYPGASNLAELQSQTKVVGKVAQLN